MMQPLFCIRYTLHLVFNGSPKSLRPENFKCEWYKHSANQCPPTKFLSKFLLAENFCSMNTSLSKSLDTNIHTSLNLADVIETRSNALLQIQSFTIRFSIVNFHYQKFLLSHRQCSRKLPSSLLTLLEISQQEKLHCYYRHLQIWDSPYL